MIKHTDILTIDNIPYVKADISINYLNISKNTYNSFFTTNCNDVNLIKFKRNKYISLKSLTNLKELQDKFWKEHIDATIARNTYPEKLLLGKEKVPIPFYAKNTKSLIAYKRSDIETDYKKMNETQSLYIPRYEAIELLCLSTSNFQKMLKQHGMKLKFNGFDHVCLKEDICFLREQQKNLGKIYISFNEVCDIYGRAVMRRMNRYPLPFFARRKDIFGEVRTGIYYYDRREIEEYINKRTLKDNYHSTECDTYFNTFTSRLSLREDFNNSPTYPYTKDK